MLARRPVEHPVNRELPRQRVAFLPTRAFWAKVTREGSDGPLGEIYGSRLSFALHLIAGLPMFGYLLACLGLGMRWHPLVMLATYVPGMLLFVFDVVSRGLTERHVRTRLDANYRELLVGKPPTNELAK